MSITIKYNKMNFKDENGEYTGINGIADKKTSEQIAAIQAEGLDIINALEKKESIALSNITSKGTEVTNTAAAAMEAKAAETIAQIPDDYTELNNKVSQVNESIDEISNDIVNTSKLNPYLIVHSEGGTEFIDIETPFDGRINTSGAVEAYANMKVTDYIPLDGRKIIRVANNSTKFTLQRYAFYDANKNYIAPTVNLNTNYEYAEMYGYPYATEIDISTAPTNSAYIRLAVSTSHNARYIAVVETEGELSFDIKAEMNSDTTRKIESDIADVCETVNKMDIGRLDASNFIVFKTGMPCFTSTWIADNGDVRTGSSYEQYDTTDFIPCAIGEKYKTLNAHRLHFYDADKNWIYPCIKPTEEAVNGVYDFEITNTNVAYMRISFVNNLSVNVYGIMHQQNEFEIVNFGDSIFGLNPAMFDISSVAQEKTGYIFANCGFGGTTASDHSASSTDDYNAYSFHSLADAIHDNEFSRIIGLGNKSTYYAEHSERLSTIDFSKIKMITVAYGTNDWNFGHELDNDENRYDKTTYCGGLRYGIERILETHPHICIALMSPLFRMIDGASVDGMTNSKGKTLRDFCEAMESVAREYHLPYFNHYDCGHNAINNSVITRDGTHLSYIVGADFIGGIVGADVKRLLG